MPDTSPAAADAGRSIWYSTPNLDDLNRSGLNTLLSHLGIVFTGFGPNWLEASMPVDDRTRQPMGLLHGGASLALAETVSSLAGVLVLNEAERYIVGMELNANHLRAVRNGVVYAVATAEHLGRSSHVWTIRIRNGEGQLVCLARATLAVRDRATLASIGT